MGTSNRQAEKSLAVFDIISKTSPFSQRVVPESGILMGYSVVQLTEYQGTEPRSRGEACKDDSLHYPSSLD